MRRITVPTRLACLFLIAASLSRARGRPRRLQVAVDGRGEAGKPPVPSEVAPPIEEPRLPPPGVARRIRPARSAADARSRVPLPLDAKEIARLNIAGDLFVSFAKPDGHARFTQSAARSSDVKPQPRIPRAAAKRADDEPFADPRIPRWVRLSTPAAADELLLRAVPEVGLPRKLDAGRRRWDRLSRRTRPDCRC